MKGRIGKYKDKIVVWGDPNLTAKNEINIDSLEGGESQTGDSDSMNYYIAKNIDLSKKGSELFYELLNKCNANIPILMGVHKFTSTEKWSEEFFKRVSEYSEKFAGILDYIYEYSVAVVATEENVDSTLKTIISYLNNFRYLYIIPHSSGNMGTDWMEINYSEFRDNNSNNLNGILCFSTPKILSMANADIGNYGQILNSSSNETFINPIEEAIYDKEVLNECFEKVSKEDYNKFIDTILKGFGG